MAAIWTGAVLSVAFTAYADGYSTVVSVTSILLYLSYAMPIAAGLVAYRRHWTRMGPWDMGPGFRVAAGLALVAVVVITGAPERTLCSSPLTKPVQEAVKVGLGVV